MKQRVEAEARPGFSPETLSVPAREPVEYNEEAAPQINPAQRPETAKPDKKGSDYGNDHDANEF
jgi:hypothetical protein